MGFLSCFGWEMSHAEMQGEIVSHIGLTDGRSGAIAYLNHFYGDIMTI